MPPDPPLLTQHAAEDAAAAAAAAAAKEAGRIRELGEQYEAALPETLRESVASVVERELVRLWFQGVEGAGAGECMLAC